MLIIPELKLCYQDTPKVGSSSVVSWLYKLISGRDFAREYETEFRALNAHQYFDIAANTHSRQVDIAQFNPADYPDYFVFAFTRDPIRRFLSMYSNRIVYARKLSEDSDAAENIRRAGLDFNPEINVLVDKLAAYMACQKVVHHHAKPSVDFLGPNLSIYTSLADLNSFDKTIAQIQKHFRNIGRPDLARVSPAETRYQTGGPKLGLEVLNPYSFECLVEYYKADYATLPTLNLQETRAAYNKARVTAAENLATRVTNLPRQKNGQEIVTSPCPQVSFSQIRCDIAPKVGVVVRGAVLLQPELSAADYSLHLIGDDLDIQAQWREDSEYLVARFAENPHAATAKFRVFSGVNAGNYFVLELRSRDGQRWTVAEIDQSRIDMR